MAQLEEVIPWTAVRKYWRTKRSSWRRAVRDAGSTAAMAGCLRDLQAALLVHAFPGHHTAGRAALHLGPVWQQSLASCLDGGEKHAMLLALWNDFKKQVTQHHWLLIRVLPCIACGPALQDDIIQWTQSTRRAKQWHACSGCLRQGFGSWAGSYDVISMTKLVSMSAFAGALFLHAHELGKQDAGKFHECCQLQWSPAASPL